MKSFNRVLISVLLLTIAVSGAVFANGGSESKDAGGDDQITIAYIGATKSMAFWNTLGKEAANRADELGVKFIDLTPPELTASEQKKAMDNVILQGVDGIIIGAADNRAFGESLDKAKAAGIPVVAVDTGIEHEQVKSLVQTDNLASARLAGQYIVDNMDPGKILIIGGTVGHQTGNARRDGVMQVAEANGVEAIFRACDWDDTKAFETTQNELGANPDITAIFACWDPGAMSVKAAVKDKGLLDKVVIVGFDGNPANLKAVKAGEIEAEVKQDNVLMGRKSVEILVDIINGKAVEEFYPINGFIIDASNVDEYL